MRILKYSILIIILLLNFQTSIFAQPSFRSLGMKQESSELLSSLKKQILMGFLTEDLIPKWIFLLLCLP